MNRKRTLWITLFVLFVLLVGGLAVGWNWVLVATFVDTPWNSIVWGSLGFALLLAGFISFFVRLLLEMRLSQTQAEFLAAISHELKTPISTLELTSQLLQTPSLSPEDRVVLWRSHRTELTRLREDVERILETTRYESGLSSRDLMRHNLEQWLQKNNSRWQAFLAPTCVLRREGEPLDFEMRTDLRELDLIIENLLSNSKKFSPQEGGSPIELTTHVTPAEWSLSVRDYGIGLPQSELRKIFNRFYRSKNHGILRQFSGTGLGLYLAQKAARGLGLTLEARLPEMGPGLEFVLRGRRTE